MSVKINLPVYLTLVVMLMSVSRTTHNDREYLDRNYTSIIISGKTLIIKPAQGYSPIITSDQNKPLVILERDPSQKRSVQFDQVIVVNEDG